MSGGYNLGTASGRIEIDGSGAQKGFEVAQAAAATFMQSVENQRAQMEEYGKSLTRQAIVGAGGFAVATKSAADFEKELSGIRAVSGASADQMALVATAALKIGADTTFSASQAAQAFSELVKAGIPVEQALDGAARATVDLAAAGEISLPRAAEIAANAMNNFNKSGKDMPKIADLIAGAANASAISVEEFAQSLSQVGAVANLSGLSFDDVSVAIAEMGNAGIKGSDAGTSLKTMLMNLQPVTDAQIKKFEELGLSTFSSDKALKAMAKDGIPQIGTSMDNVREAISKYLHETQGIKDDTKEMGKAVDDYLQSNGAMQNAFFTTEGKAKTLGEMQQVLADATKGMTEEQKLASLETLFGADAIRAAAIMAKNGAAGFNDLAASMGKVGAADVANTRMDNLAGDIETLKGAWETLSIRLGTIFLPVVRDVIQWVTKLVQFFANATDYGVDMMSHWLVFKTIGMGVTGVLITMISHFGGLLTVLIGIKTAFTFVDSAKAAFGALRAGEGIVKALSIVMTSSIRGSILFRTAFKAIELIFTRFLGFGRIVAIIAGIGPAMAGGVGPLAAFAAAGAGIGRTLLMVGGRILSLITGVNRVAGVFGLLGGPVGLAIRILLGLITAGKLLYGTWEPFRNLVDGIAASLGGAFQDALTWIQGAWQGIIDGFNGVNSAGSGTGDVFHSIGEGAKFLLQWLAQIWDGIVANVVPAFNQMMEVIGGTIGPAMQDLGNTVSQTLWPALQQLGKVIVEQLFPALGKVWDFILPIIIGIGILVGAIIGGLFFAFVKIVEFLLGVVLPVFLQLAGPVIGFLITFIGHLIEVIVALITPLIWLATFIFGTLIPGIIAFAGALINSLVVAFNWVVGAIQEVINWFTNLPNVIADIDKTVNGFFAGIGQGIADGFNGAVAFVSGVFDAITAAIQWYIGVWIAVISGIIEFWRPIWEPMIAIISAVFDVIMAIANGFGQLFAKLFQFLFGFISMLIGVFIANVTANWTAFWNGLVTVVQTIGQFIADVWNTTVAVVSAVFNGFMAAMNAQWSAFWNGLMAFLQPVVDWFNSTIGAWWNSMFAQSSDGSNATSNVIMDVWNGIVAFFQGVLNWIGNIIAGAFNWYVSTIVGIMQWIWNSIVSTWNGIVGAVSGVLNWLNGITGGAFGNMVNSIRGFMSDLWNNIVNTWNSVMDFFRGVPGTIQNIFSGAFNWLANVGQTIIDGLLSGLRGAAGGIKDFFNGLTDMIPEWKGPPKRDAVLLKPAGLKIVNSLKDGFESGMKDFYDTVNSMNTNIPLALNAVINPDIPNLSGVLNGVQTNSTNITAPEPAKIQMTPKFDVTVKLGDKDITDIVDVRVTEHLDEVSSLIGTGVNS